VSPEGFKTHNGCCAYGKGVPILDGPRIEGLPLCGGVTRWYLEGVPMHVASKMVWM
jgi:hypothetical protein